MLSEKIIAKRADRLVIIVSEEKIVDRLGRNFAIPIEVVPEALNVVEEELKALGAREITVREAVKKFGPVVTEHNNLVIDAWFDNIEPTLEGRLKQITGVVESGLFTGFNPEVLVAKNDGVYALRLKGAKLEQELVEQA